MAQRGLRTRLIAGLVAAGVLAAACSGDGSGDEATPTEPSNEQTAADDATADDAATSAATAPAASTNEDGGSSTPDSSPDASAAPAQPVAADCTPAPAESAVAWEDGESVEVEQIGETPDGYPIRAAVYPGPAETGNPWSQWGQGAVTSNGRFLSAVGDQLGPAGNSYLYEFNPESGRLTMVGDVLSLVDHQSGAWGYGKIHAQMVTGPCGEVYATTYWGTRRNLEYGNGYEGDLMLRLDPAARTTTLIGVPMPGFGVPSMAGSAEHAVLFGEATDPASDPDGGSFFAYDIATGETTVVDDSADHVGFRALAVDAEGRALFTKPAGRLTRYDPATGETEQLDDSLPGEFLRAATPPAPDGTIYGVTQDPDRFIALRPDDTIEDLGAAPGYTVSLAMEPDGATVYFIPGAHGDSAEEDTPLYALDTATGDQEVVVELNPMTEDALGISADGTYNLVLDAANRRLFIGFNGAEAGQDKEEFGEVVLVEVTLPPADGAAATEPPETPATSPSTEEPNEEDAAAAVTVSGSTSTRRSTATGMAVARRRCACT